MGGVKDIQVRPIASADARRFIQRWHYSGKVINKSQLAFGAFLAGRLVGVLQYGSPMDKAKVLPLVQGTKWNDMLELNRMAMVDETPRNAESRVIAITAAIIRKQYPNVEWVLSFSDGCQCGDGTIYRASGFLLTGIKKNATIYKYQGEGFTSIGLSTSSAMRARFSRLTGASIQSVQDMMRHGAIRLAGYQLRYVLPLKPGVRERLTVPVLPYGDIAKAGASMYLGKTRVESIVADAPTSVGEGGSIPTSTLQSPADIQSVFG